MGFSDSQHLRKMVAGTCMLLAPFVMLIAAVVSPELETKAGAQLATAAGHLDRFYVSNLLGMVALILLVPAVLGLMHMVRERRGAGGAGGGGVTGRRAPPAPPWGGGRLLLCANAEGRVPPGHGG